MTAFGAIILRDVKLGLRQGGGTYWTLLFFVLTVTLFPLGVGPDLALLSRIGPGILWVVALLASMLSLDRMFQADYEDGSLELLALAPLPLLLSYAKPLMSPNAVCLFLKGQNVVSELTEAHKSWNMEASQVPSKTDPSGAILVVRKLVSRDEHPSPHAPRPGRRQPKGRRR